MDDLVKAALKKWPNVPACCGWLGLDARGQWWMRDDRAQACGSFDSGKPGAKGSMLKHDKLIEFIGRNYECEAQGSMQGAWFFQNGPQKVYVELESTPLILRVNAHNNGFSLATHFGQAVSAHDCLLDEHGHLYLSTALGLGLVHSQDIGPAADIIEAGLWEPKPVNRLELPAAHGFIKSPMSLAGRA